MHPSSRGSSLVIKKPTGARFLWSWSLVVGLAFAGPAKAAEPLDELAATRRICAAGPVAAVAKAQRMRGSAEIASAGLLPNPSVVVEHQRSLTGSTDRETIVGISVPLGIGGRRWLLQDAAARRDEQAHAEANVTLFDAALAFREAYSRAALEQARVNVLGEQQKTLDDLEAIIRRLTKGGETAGYDLLRQQTQALLHQSLLDGSKARALAFRASLDAWTDRELVVRPLERAPFTGAEAPAGAISETATIRALQAASRAAALDARVARRRWVPDLDVFAGYRQLASGQDTGHGVSVGLTLPLTLFDHGQGDAARADTEHDVALAVVAKLRREQFADVKASRIRLEGLRGALAQAEQAAGKATEVQNKARQLYAAGEATITDVLDAIRGVEEAHLVRLALIEEMAKTRLALMRAAGTMFDPSLDRACGEPTPRKPR
jgi:outer membrane protein, heavy metal efflux system